MSFPQGPGNGNNPNPNNNRNNGNPFTNPFNRGNNGNNGKGNKENRPIWQSPWLWGAVLVVMVVVVIMVMIVVVVRHDRRCGCGVRRGRRRHVGDGLVCRHRGRGLLQAAGGQLGALRQILVAIGDFGAGQGHAVGLLVHGADHAGQAGAGVVHGLQQVADLVLAVEQCFEVDVHDTDGQRPCAGPKGASRDLWINHELWNSAGTWLTA